MSSLEARVAKLEKVAAPDDKLCVTVEITRNASHLLTAGAAERSRKRQPRGHVHNGRCIRVSINRHVELEPAVSEGTRGDSAAPQLALPAPVDASAPPTVPTGQSDAQRAPAGVYGDGGAVGSTAPELPAREAVVEVDRTDVPLVSPLEVERRREDAAVALAFARDVQQLVPWWLPVVPSELGLCAEPYCSHAAEEHRGIREHLKCRRCGFQADQHHSDGLALVVPQYARRVSPCDNYRAIYVDAIDSDRCEHPDCRCRGWRRWVSRDSSDPHVAFADLWAERERLIAETERELAELRARIASEQRQAVKPNDYGPSPRTCPVFVEGENT